MLRDKRTYVILIVDQKFKYDIPETTSDGSQITEFRQ